MNEKIKAYVQEIIFVTTDIKKPKRALDMQYFPRAFLETVYHSYYICKVRIAGKNNLKIGIKFV